MKETSLERAFHFTSDDLQQNREGHLSGAQAQYLRGKAISLAAIIIVILAGAGLVTFGTGQADPSEYALLTLALVIPAVITLAVTVGATELAISPGVVSKRSGTLHVAYGINGYNPPLEDMATYQGPRFMLARPGAYTIFVDDQEFRISRDQWQLLPPGAFAVVYWVPTIRKIVAVEIVEQPEMRTPSEPLLAAPKPALPPLPGPSSDDNDVIRA